MKIFVFTDGGSDCLGPTNHEIGEEPHPTEADCEGQIHVFLIAGPSHVWYSEVQTENDRQRQKVPTQVVSCAF